MWGIRILIFGFFLWGCAKQLDLRSEAHQKYEAGDFQAALKELEKNPYRKQDKLLYLLDQATFLHAAGQYEESNKIFEEAYHLAEYLESRSAGQEIAASLTSETVLPYRGEKYERLLIQVYQMLNYSLLGKLDEALVEVRQYHNDLYRFFGSKVPKAYQDSFALGLASILWELNGQTDDARIDYQKALKANPKSGVIRNEGNVIVILESGRSPILGTQKTWVADILLALPKMESRDRNIQPALIQAGGETVATTTPLNDIGKMVEAILEKKLEIAKNHKFVKTALKQWGEMKGLYTLKNRPEQAIITVAGISIILNTLEEADTRIWSSLPNHFQIARFSLPPGEHKLKVVLNGKTITQKIKPERTKPIFLSCRTF